MHTDLTLQVLSQVTKSLGDSLRTFEEKICSSFDTRELECERSARQQCQKKNPADTASGSSRFSTSARKQRKLNLRTYKYHALGDYVDTIKCFGTMDLYSTQAVSFSGFIWFCLVLTVSNRANSSTKSRRHALVIQVADQYHSNSRELSNISAVSA
jgi:hypothetical protein